MKISQYTAHWHILGQFPFWQLCRPLTMCLFIAAISHFKAESLGYIPYSLGMSSIRSLPFICLKFLSFFPFPLPVVVSAPWFLWGFRQWIWHHWGLSPKLHILLDSGLFHSFNPFCISETHKSLQHSLYSKAPQSSPPGTCRDLSAADVCRSTQSWSPTVNLF